MLKIRHYAKPQNAFWKIIAARIGDLPTDYGGRVAALATRGIALWDVLAAATRRGGADAAIADLAACDTDADGAAKVDPDEDPALLERSVCRAPVDAAGRSVVSYLISRLKTGLFTVPWNHSYKPSGEISRSPHVREQYLPGCIPCQ